jgi:Tol biopolymer transport system component
MAPDPPKPFPVSNTTCCLLVATIPVLMAGAFAALWLMQRWDMMDEQCGVDVTWHAATNTVAFTTCGTEEHPLPRNRVYALNLRTLKTRVLFDDADSVSCPVFSRDGARLAYLRETEQGEQTMVYDLRTGASSKVSGPSDKCAVPVAFTPDGLSVIERRPALFKRYGMFGEREKWTDFDLWLVSTRTRKERRLTNGKHSWITAPAFVGDGQTMAYIVEGEFPDLNWYLYVAQAPWGAPARRVGVVGLSADTLAATGGSHTVVFDRSHWYSVNELAAMDLATGKVDRVCPKLLLGRPGGQTSLAWDTSGEQFLLIENSGGRNELSVVDVGRCERKQIADSTLFDDPLKWRPKPESEEEEE